VEAFYHARNVAIFQTRKPVHSRSLEWLKNPAKIVKFEDNHRLLQAAAYFMPRYPALSLHACVRLDHG
jgi:Holliday junction resolvase-like predicted endonuclease